MKKIISSILCLTLMFSLCSCTKKETVKDIYSDLVYDEENNIWYSDKDKYMKLVDIMKKDVTASADYKGSYILATDDEIIFIGGVNATDTDGNKVDAYTTYEIGSITKMITATAVLQLIDKGELSLDDKLEKFFPEFTYGKIITISQLLHMTSGLRRDFVTDDTFLTETGERDYEEWKNYIYDGYSDEKLLGMAFDDELEFKPGSKYLYSNIGYTLLAMIIEQITGQSFGEYVQTNIFDVCGMEHSSSMKTGDVNSIPEPVKGVNDTEGIPVEIDTLYLQMANTLRGCGDMHSCVADLLMFDRALIGGKLLGKDSLSEMFNKKNKYGCGWIQYNGYSDSWYHGGESFFYLGYNMYIDTNKYGNLYLIQLHPTVAGDEYSQALLKDLSTAGGF